MQASFERYRQSSTNKCFLLNAICDLTITADKIYTHRKYQDRKYQVYDGVNIFFEVEQSFDFWLLQIH